VISHPVLSADGHIDLPLLPADLFSARAPNRLRDRMPRVEARNGARFWVDASGQVIARVGGSGHLGQPYVKGESRRLDRMNESGFWDDAAHGVCHATQPDLRVAAQDRDGIAGEVLYGILGLSDKFGDAEVCRAALAAYNDFLADFVANHPRRLKGVACLPAGDPQAAIGELQRVAKKGLAGVELALTHGMAPLWRSEFEPLWRAAAETKLPLHLHTIGPPIDLQHAQSRRDVDSWMGTWLTTFQLGMVERLAELIFGGVLHRHPDLRIVLGESGIGWLPYVLDRMDLEWEERLRHLELTLPPSGYFRRQVFATFQLDEAGLLLADRIGLDNLMWGNDFPHGDGVWPDSLAHLEAQFARVPESWRRKIAYENAARVYGFPLAD
jgi:predicted TIM-barrel fold metal-dependent hydrolase